METLGKIFIYEENTRHIQQFVDELEAQGFFTFGTDNLYKFLKYSEEVKPDVVIMNFPTNFEATEKTWQNIEKSLCRSQCPQIYINAMQRLSKKSEFHYTEFQTANITKEQIVSLIRQGETHNYLH